MPKIEKCFRCFKLETGGLIISWIIILLPLICVTVALTLCLGSLINGCDFTQKSFKHVTKVGWNFCHGHSNSHIDPAVIVVPAIMTATISMIGFLGIKGIRKKDELLIRPVMYLLVLTIVISLVGLIVIKRNFILLLLLTILICLCCYSQLVVYSLYDKFKTASRSNFDLTLERLPRGPRGVGVFLCFPAFVSFRQPWVVQEEAV